MDGMRSAMPSLLELGKTQSGRAFMAISYNKEIAGQVTSPLTRCGVSMRKVRRVVTMIRIWKHAFYQLEFGSLERCVPRNNYKDMTIHRADV